MFGNTRNSLYICEGLDNTRNSYRLQNKTRLPWLQTAELV